ncbi:bacillithiol biosynthesis cysteine-adding enzyme BshC [Salipaludibacillus sp. CUR1]|uniref:bacillithiol biosynthesis cysteine-adding enzyme BshC n=1 Tax=Salipaludibacillus sp. CUR1 TaxID=2820003 RepID=UPI001E600ACA|nr:bacillithiol biosynthesis cysteine-adding enzyme BshC [Salipaludibacillus sp. CUR1]MCE7794711.1 bacillithiol biosynthesis cysteine-adding enzyme BshC [Salipaludibacillus sp. CUR1]
MQFRIETTYQENSYIHNYLNGDKQILSFYDYGLGSKDCVSRYEELKNRAFPREELVEALMNFNRKYHPSERALHQIERLRDKNSVTVVGGQQAGLLTGPLYTVNKIITILVESKKLEEKLAAPVVPLFWIAGEDHDIDEVNHTYFSENAHVRKVRIPERNDIKQPMSERNVNIENAKSELQEAFQYLEETPFTRGIYDTLMEELSGKLTYTEWCARVLHRLFKDTDLVLMDAADPAIREIERPFFTSMVRNNTSIQRAFLEQADEMKANAYGEPIETDENNAHLFYHEGRQRFLLERTEEGFKEKHGDRIWSEDDFLYQVEDGRIQLSNNVVTRPLMQEFLLPVHSFIAGPGELKYWGVLKKVFHSFDRKMPVVFPRYHLTYLSRTTEKNLQKYEVDVKTVTLNGLTDFQSEFLSRQKKVNESKVFEEAEQELKELADNIRGRLSPIGKNVSAISNHFESKMIDELKDYERKINQLMLSQNNAHLLRFDKIEAEVRPHGKWQERHLNIFPFLNRYGPDLVDRTVAGLMEKKESICSASHIYVYL